jgi:threonine dehydratase
MQDKAVLGIGFEDIEAARQRIAPYLQPTPLAYSQYFSELWGCKAYFKFENLHLTGSFKERGALNKLLCLSAEERGRGVITASAGNHGRAVAWHAQRLGIPATVVMPVNSPIVKVQNTAATGARVVLHGESFDDAVEHARALCQKEGLTYVHGFDDPLIVAGQGTIGLELTEQCPYLDMVVVPVGGGGLAAGIAVAMKEINPKVKIVGVQSADVPSMLVALEKQEPVTVPPHFTIADGIAVRRVGALPLEIFRRYVDEIVAVDEPCRIIRGNWRGFCPLWRKSGAMCSKSCTAAPSARRKWARRQSILSSKLVAPNTLRKSSRHSPSAASRPSDGSSRPRSAAQRGVHEMAVRSNGDTRTGGPSSFEAKWCARGW